VGSLKYHTAIPEKCNTIEEQYRGCRMTD